MNELFKNISWTQYLIVVSAVFMIYYALVALLYFRKDLLAKLASKNKSSEKGTELYGDDPGSELSEQLKSTKKEIGHSILVPGTMATKRELIEQLKVSVANFGGLSRPGYRYALNDYIRQEARENCGIDFSEQELEEAWDSLSR